MFSCETITRISKTHLYLFGLQNSSLCVWWGITLWLHLKGSALADTFHMIKPSLHLNYKLKTYKNDRNKKWSRGGVGGKQCLSLIMCVFCRSNEWMLFTQQVFHVECLFFFWIILIVIILYQISAWCCLQKWCLWKKYIMLFFTISQKIWWDN